MLPIIRLVSGLILWILTILLLSPPLIILLIYKFCVLYMAKLKFFFVGGTELIPLKALDSMISRGQDVTSNVNIGLVCKLRGEISLSNLQQHVIKTFLNPENEHPRLSSTLVKFGGYQFFKKLEPDEINIQRQIYTRQLQGGERLEDFLCKWVHEKFAKNSPCWEMVLVSEPDGGDGIKDSGCVVGMKFHHGFMDGYSAHHIFDRLTGNVSPNLARIEQKLSWKNTILRMIEAPLHLNLFMGDPSSNPFPVNLTKNRTSEWTMACTTLDLEMLKTIRKRENVYFASILFTIMGGALRRYLVQENKKLPQYFYMGMAQLWPDHPVLKQHPIYSGEKICNLWLPAHFVIPSKDQGPRVRLREVEKSFTSFLEKGLHKFFQYFIPPLMTLLPNCVKRGGINGSDPGFTAMYSTMVGGNGYKLLGQGVEDIHLFGTADDFNPYLPIVLSSFSHDGKYQLTVGTNCQNFGNGSDLERVVKVYLQEELKLLYESVKGKA